MANEPAALTVTKAQMERAFDTWWRAARLAPETYLAEDECKCLSVSELAARCGDQFFERLAEEQRRDEPAKAFLPDCGEMFYAKCTRTPEDRSWGGTIFRMVTSDHHAVISDIVYGADYIDNKRVMLARRDYDFSLVGQDVLAAVGLLPNPDDRKDADG